jgi:hypothetical protein
MPNSWRHRLTRFQAWLCRNGAELVLFSVAFGLYLPGLGWGLPNATGPDRVRVWAVDDISPVGVLTECHNTLSRKSLEDRWLAYPLCHHFLLGAAYSPYFLYLKSTGGFGQPSATFPYGLADPATAFRALTVIARLVSVAMAAGIVVVAYRIGRILWDRKTGVLAGLMALVPYPMFYYAKTANLEIPCLFWGSLGLLMYAKMLVEGITTRRAALLGVFAGLAAATKDQTAGLFLLMPLVLIPLHWKAWRAGKVSLWAPPLALLTLGIIVYALTSGLALDPARWRAHMSWGFERSTEFTAPYVTFYPMTVTGIAGYLAAVVHALFLSLGPIVLALAGIGVMATAKGEALKLAFGMAAVSYLVTFLLPQHYFRIRYAMPIAFIACVFAGRGLVSISSWMDRPRLAGGIVVLVALAWPLFMSADLVAQMLNDSRQDAAVWLAEHVAGGDRVAYFGGSHKLPTCPADVELLALPSGDDSMCVLRKRRPEVVLVLPDFTSAYGAERSASCAQEVYQGLQDGTSGYRLAARFHSPHCVHWQLLDFPCVNPPVQVFVRADWSREAASRKPD